MNMPIKTWERPAKVYDGQTSRPQLVRTHQRKPERELNRGDLLAVPLCILWGVCLWLSMYGPWAIFGLESNSGAGGWLSSLWALPIAAAKHLLGR